MDSMDFFLELFNSREKAAFIWLAVFAVACFAKKKVRSSFYSVLRALFYRKIAAALILMALYVILVGMSLSRVLPWDASLTKGAVYWFVGTAFVLFLNISSASKEENWFKKLLFDNFKIIIVIEYVANLYVFSFWVEVVLMPILFTFAMMNAIAGTSEEYSQAEKVLNNMLFCYGLFILALSGYAFVMDIESFMSAEGLSDFFLPPLLSIAFIPFLYLAALLMAYEFLFARMSFFFKDRRALEKYAKRRVLLLCLLNLWKLNVFAKDYAMKLMWVKSEEDVFSLMDEFRNTYPLGVVESEL